MAVRWFLLRPALSDSSTTFQLDLAVHCPRNTSFEMDTLFYFYIDRTPSALSIGTAFLCSWMTLLLLLQPWLVRCRIFIFQWKINPSFMTLKIIKNSKNSCSPFPLRLYMSTFSFCAICRAFSGHTNQEFAGILLLLSVTITFRQIESYSPLIFSKLIRRIIKFNPVTIPWHSYWNRFPNFSVYWLTAGLMEDLWFHSRLLLVLLMWMV